MKKKKVIPVYEHERLRIGERGFKQEHLDALLKLNDFHDGLYFEPVSRGIKFNQYVGVIQIDGLTIEINPKADRNDDDGRWQGVLLKMLHACGKIKASSTGPAHVKRQHLNLLEVYFEIYLNEIESLIRRGLIKKYRLRKGNLKALKGKLEFAQNIRQNLIHKERFFTSYQVYDRLHLLHQILNEALEIVDQFTRGTRLYDSCKRVRLNFPEQKRKQIGLKHFDLIKLDRKLAPYSYALELSKLIILQYSPDIASGKERMLSLLFDMNQLWEEYIIRMLRKATEGTDILISGQESKDFWGPNSLRPDIVIRKGDETYIIDTKWKTPYSNSASVSDLRQIYAYCRYWEAHRAILLYPGDRRQTVFREFLAEDFQMFDQETIRKIRHYCKLGFVSVFDDDSNQLDQEIGRKILELFEIQDKVQRA